MNPHSTTGTSRVRPIAYVPAHRDADVWRVRVTVRPARRDSGAYLLLGVLIVATLCFLGVLDAAGILI